jgi:putative FmdB family regulatory protein
MPIYAYRCASCGHSRDVLQKMSDPVLTTCPVCGAEQFQKQVTAAGFQLKGSGWYATDFKGGAAPAPAVAPATPGEAGGATPAAAPAPGSAPAPAPAPAPSSDGGAPSASASSDTHAGGSRACH